METVIGGTDPCLHAAARSGLRRAALGIASIIFFACNSTVHTEGTPVPEGTGNNASAGVGGKGGLGLSGGASWSDSAGGTLGSRSKSASSSPKGSGSSGGEDSTNSSTGGEGSLGGQGGEGGAANAGGVVVSSGGNANAGGTVNANGGTLYTGGTTNTGGKLNLGGVGGTNVVTNGGVVSTGGKVSTGGTISTGGVVNTGGRISTGGTVSTGGTTNSAIGGCDLSKPFGAPTLIFSGGGNSSENSISVQDDGTSALISLRADASSSLDLRRYSRGSIDKQFGSPMEMRGAANINTSADEGQVRLSRDGNDLYFTRTLADSTSAIYNAKRNNTLADFPVPSRMDALINFTSVIGASWIAPDNSYFYWIADDQKFGLYRAEITASGFANRMAMAVINSTGPVMAPAFTDDQKTLYFASNGSDASALEQVWRATRQSATAVFSTPTRVTELADPQVRNYPQDVSPDGCILYFAKTVNGNSTTRHLYQAVKPR